MKKEKSQIYYEAFKRKDSRFDGRFFVGISSTKIYCRPICKAKLARPENCTFFSSAAEAEQANFRPCLLCRPELTPGSAPIDYTVALVYKAAKIMEENCAHSEGIKEIAKRLCCSDRHLRRAFLEHFNVPPIQYLQTCRLLLAKSLLTTTNLSVLDVAMASGFGSLRRFNDLFQKRYALAPTALRKQATPSQPHDGIMIEQGYRPPYHWQSMLAFLSARTIPGVELVKNDEYMRTVRLNTDKGKELFGWIRVGHKAEKNTLTLTVSTSLLTVLPQIIFRVRNLFDINADPEAIYETLKSMNKIKPDLCVFGMRLPGCFDSFEMAARAVLGQQITVKAARTLASRLVNTFGTPVQTEIEGLTHAFPSPKNIINLGTPIENHLGPLGIIGARAKTIQALAQAIEQKLINFNFCTNIEAEIQKLMTLPGIGKWTAEYIAMRALSWPDIFLETDYGIKKALEGHSSKEILAISENWKPWRSYATINLWNSL